MKISQFQAREILDSRGRPTLSVRCELADGATGTASVPSGSSRGSNEALELRDSDPRRYGGWGCLGAVRSVSDISDALAGVDVLDQAELDRRIIEFEGTPDKARLGANAVLGASLAFARAAARQAGLPLYEYFAALAGTSPRLPRLQVNLFSGGAHAGARVSIQDIMVMPQAPGIDGALVAMSAVYEAAARLIESRYGAWRLTADEGGLAPSSPNVAGFIQDALDAVTEANLGPGDEILLGIDVASSQFFADGRYRIDGAEIDEAAMVARIAEWVDRFSLASVEDGLADSRMEGWPRLVAAIGNRAMVVGDDLLCTNPARIRSAAKIGACTALLLKLNQIGSVSEGLAALHSARAAGWKVIVSARSGETEDDWLADLAVGWAGDLIKVGSITQSERLAKYNRLLEIEEILRHQSPKRT